MSIQLSLIRIKDCIRLHDNIGGCLVIYIAKLSSKRCSSCRCIPFKHEICDEGCDNERTKKITKVLMISSQSGPGLLFPKVWCY